MEKSIVVYSYKVANELLKRGFMMDEIQPNRNSKGILVFYFKYNYELVEVLDREYGVKINK